ncbi:phage tail domain-containing protein [Enterococcus rotai]|uniref:phage tail domain-containing protein n=1 Tax=Enterococcus rotai TaxID=118060 RepID=UPI0032B54D53
MLNIIDGSQIWTLADFGIQYITDSTEPILADFSERKRAIPNRPGYWDFGDEIGSKSTEITCSTVERDRYAFNENLRKLKSVLLDAKGQPKILQLQFEYDLKHFFFGKVSKSSLPTGYNFVKEFTLEFIRNDPAEYAESKAFDLDRPLEYDAKSRYGAKSYPNTESFKWMYRKHYSSIVNYSNFDTPVKISVRGSVTNGSVTHMETGRKICFPTVTNGSVVIDSNSFNLTVNGVDRIFNGDFIELVEGSNSFLFEGTTPNATVSFDWHHKFM